MSNEAVAEVIEEERAEARKMAADDMLEEFPDILTDEDQYAAVTYRDQRYAFHCWRLGVKP